jgi:hypothetical protein
MVKKLYHVLANDYLSAVLLGVIGCLVFKLFWLPAFAFFLFVAQLYSGSKYGFMRVEQLGFMVVQVAFIAWANPSSYMFTVFYVMALLWFCLGKLRHGRLLQNMCYIGMLSLFFVSPSILFFVTVHYQRLLFGIVEVFV